LKHDTVLYSKMPEMMGGGGPPMSGPAPAYVEPNPNAFYRLAYAAQALTVGIKPQQEDWSMRGWNEVESVDASMFYSTEAYVQHLSDLAERLGQLGDIAARELQGQELTVDDYGLIQGCLEYKECLDHGAYTQNPPEQEPIPLVAAVSGAEDRVLEASVGNLNRIFVAVPLEGKLEIAQGGVFSYYEFTQPRSDRLTDQAWRDKIAANLPVAPAWTKQFLLDGGKPHNALAFRVGDTYYVTEAGGNPPLNMRSGPSKSQNVVSKLEKDAYLTIIDGPEKNSEGTWWKVRLELFDATEGWVLENPEWLARSDNY
jgi:Protein of unknown function (DUF3160)/Bacterial SH3 domain